VKRLYLGIVLERGRKYFVKTRIRWKKKVGIESVLVLNGTSDVTKSFFTHGARRSSDIPDTPNRLELEPKIMNTVSKGIVN
jgi:hypothetical protein